MTKTFAHNLMTLGMLVSLLALVPVAHAAIGEGLRLTAEQWRYDAVLGTVGIAVFYVGLGLSLVPVRIK